MSAMFEELIMDFPTHRSLSMRSVHFADTAKLHIVPRLDDSEHVHRRHDIWYNDSDYSRMKLDNQSPIAQPAARCGRRLPPACHGDICNFRRSDYRVTPSVIPQSLTPIYFIFPSSLYIAKTERIPTYISFLAIPLLMFFLYEC